MTNSDDRFIGVVIATSGYSDSGQTAIYCPTRFVSSSELTFPLFSTDSLAILFISSQVICFNFDYWGRRQTDRINGMNVWEIDFNFVNFIKNFIKQQLTEIATFCRIMFL